MSANDPTKKIPSLKMLLQMKFYAKAEGKILVNQQLDENSPDLTKIAQQAPKP